MKNVMGIINLNEEDELLKEITRHRPLAAVPFAGRYRIIDFVLSSMVNAGIQNVGILIRNKYRSLMDHLRSGKQWDLARKRDGLFILPPNTPKLQQGDIESFYDNLDYFARSPQQYVIIAHGSVICNVDFGKAFKHHQANQADITMLYKEEDESFEDYSQCTIVECNENGWINDIAVNPNRRPSNKVALEMYIMSKALLIDMVSDCYARGGSDLLKDGIIKRMNELKISGYQYRGYLAKVYSISSYYRQSMGLLRRDKWQELFFKSGLVHTKVKDEGPSKYQDSASVSNSIIASGCIIAGRVENSILFRGVRVEEGAYIKDSIIMQKGSFSRNCTVENVVCDKNVSITAGMRLKGESQYPLVIEKGTVI